MNTPEWIKKIQKRESKATPLPWRVANWNTTYGETEDFENDCLCIEAGISGDKPRVVNRDDKITQVLSFDDIPEGWDNFWNDVRFSTHARQDVPALLEHCLKLREALQSYQQAQRRMLEKWADGNGTVKNDLWKGLHACESIGDEALSHIPECIKPRKEPAQQCNPSDN